MDTSEQYIKMCEKAVEIQILRLEERHKSTGKWQAGDFWTTVYVSDGVFTVGKCNDAWANEPLYIHHPKECIWLPRQDQLQEMVPDDSPDKYMQLANEAYSFGEFTNLQYAEHREFTSMEQLWLAFVMHEKYNKVWNGEDWIEEG